VKLLLISVNEKIEMAPNLPTNNTATEVGKPDTNTTTTGFISLERVAVDTKYDVCHDEVEKFDDYKHFWILKGKQSPKPNPKTGKSIEYYHWIKPSEIGNSTYGNTVNKNKPFPLPITISSEDHLTFTVVFKTVFPTNGIKVRVRDKDNKYKEVDYPNATRHCCMTLNQGRAPATLP
jgi:hypothetical protein